MIELGENYGVFPDFIAYDFIFEAAEFVDFDLKFNVFYYCLIKVVMQGSLKCELAQERSFQHSHIK